MNGHSWEKTLEIHLASEEKPWCHTSNKSTIHWGLAMLAAGVSPEDQSLGKEGHDQEHGWFFLSSCTLLILNFVNFIVTVIVKHVLRILLHCLLLIVWKH